MNFAGPRGFEVGDHFFEYVVHGRGRGAGAGDNGEEEGDVEDGEDDGDDEDGEEVDIEWGIPMYK